MSCALDKITFHKYIVSVKVANKSDRHGYEKGKHKCLFAKSYAYPFAGVTHHTTHSTFSFATSC
jgi:hypothetical protein